ncbi:MAG TPA: NifB/NifX family molybdenum-iron cluster-binding protein [Anaeromyxobacteraceae bacterium]|nr:NifB/NifX family molybdenum-iron cluster-binding protein [Anaeromyxobacteraceae bacterium]
MKIAFATSDGVHVDQQFRRASRLAVYQLDAAGPRLDQTFAFAPDGSVRTEERLEAIGGAAIVVGTVFGPSSVARLAERGIRAATARPGTRIAKLLARFARLEREAHVPGPP